nr:MAG TPA: hypothetical protein [Caudoviricetes sp.]
MNVLRKERHSPLWQFSYGHILLVLQTLSLFSSIRMEIMRKQTYSV